MLRPEERPVMIVSFVLYLAAAMFCTSLPTSSRRGCCCVWLLSLSRWIGYPTPPSATPNAVANTTRRAKLAASYSFSSLRGVVISVLMSDPPRD